MSQAQLSCVSSTAHAACRCRQTTVQIPDDPARFYGQIVDASSLNHLCVFLTGVSESGRCGKDGRELDRMWGTSVGRS